MKLTFVVAVKDIWQLQPSWLHPCKVCDQGRSMGKIKFTRNSKMVGLGIFPTPIFFGNAEKILKSRMLNGAF